MCRRRLLLIGSKMLCISALFFAHLAVAQSAGDVKVTLTLKEGKTTYKIGEAITLDLSFTAITGDHYIDTIPLVDDYTLDEVVIEPSDGVKDLIDRIVRRGGDAVILPESLNQGATVHFLESLNRIYRIQKPGHYSLHVMTHRLSSREAGPDGAASPRTAITSNEVTFELLPMSDAEEEALANTLVSQLRGIAEKDEPLEALMSGDPKSQQFREALARQKGQMQRARDVTTQLNYLTGDPSTRAKVYVFVRPEIFGHYRFSVMEGLATAGNRGLAVAGLEAALRNPQVYGPGIIAGEILRLRLLDKVSQEQIEREQMQYIREIAQTLPARSGKNVAVAAADVFSALKRRGQTDTPEFATARESLITQFGKVPIEYVEPLLNADWSYLHDPRIEPGLEEILGRCPEGVPLYRGVRAVTQKRLQEITSGQPSP